MKGSLILTALLFWILTTLAQTPQFWGVAGSNPGTADRLVTTIFKIDGDGTGFANIDTIAGPVQFPGNLFQASNGKLYGMLPDGVIFNIDPRNNQYNILDTIGCYNNTGCTCNGGQPCVNYPNANFVEGLPGILYGNMYDRVFGFDIATNRHTVYSAISTGEGINQMVLAADGKIYVTANDYYLGSSGSLNSFDTSVHTFLKLVDFGLNTQSYPNAIVQASNGLLYGTIAGSFSDGKIFSYNIGTGVLNIVTTFLSDVPIYDPQALIKGIGGKLYGSCASNAVYSIDVNNGDSVEILHQFSSISPQQGNGPFNLTLASDCNIYGTTEWGGGYSNGVVFKLDPLTKQYTKIFDGTVQSMQLGATGNLIELNPTPCISSTEVDYINSQKISISPVPAADYISISIPDNFLGGNLNVSDLSGRTLITTTIENGKKQIETQNYSGGIYFISVSKDDKRVIQKFVLSR